MGHIVVCLCRIKLVPGGDLIIISLPNFLAALAVQILSLLNQNLMTKSSSEDFQNMTMALSVTIAMTMAKENYDVSVILHWCKVFSFSCDPLFVSMSVLQNPFGDDLIICDLDLIISTQSSIHPLFWGKCCCFLTNNFECQKTLIYNRKCTM